jgi:hypothetical protein
MGKEQRNEKMSKKPKKDTSAPKSSDRPVPPDHGGDPARQGQRQVQVNRDRTP